VAEVVHLRGGGEVAMRPCPAWCTQARHFPQGTVADPDDGYHHYGPEADIATADRLPGLDNEPAVLRVILKSWVQPLDAGPGPARIELNLGTAAAGTDMSAELTPDQAEDVAWALLARAATARRGETPPGGGATAAGS